MRGRIKVRPRVKASGRDSEFHLFLDRALDLEEYLFCLPIGKVRCIAPVQRHGEGRAVLSLEHVLRLGEGGPIIRGDAVALKGGAQRGEYLIQRLVRF